MSQESPLAGMRTVVLLAEGVEDLEYRVTVMRLREARAEVASVGTVALFAEHRRSAA